MLNCVLSTMDVAANSAYPTPFSHSPLLPLLLLSLARQKHTPTPKTTFEEEYDYIIVGAGSAGSVLASRLSEVPCASILLLEAGKSPPLLTDVPAIARNFWFTDIDWAYKTVPQKHSGYALVNNQVVWPSGKAVGGSSVLNAMLYVRGNRENYDKWARGGAVGWSTSDICPLFMKLENNTEPEFFAKGFHAVEGPMTVRRPSYEAEIKKPIFEAAEQMGYENLDPNGEKQTGFYDFQATIRDGQRCSTGKAYLAPAENRTNLDILPNAFVRKVVLRGRNATGVEFDFGGKTYQVRARREVIMSAGTVNTAQLLMLSGIGPRKHLQQMNIPIVANLPVGNNFHDHGSTPLIFQLDPQIPQFLKKLGDPVNVQEYIQNRSGPLSSIEGIAATAFLNGQQMPKEDFPNHQIYFAEVPKEVLQYQVGLKPEVYQQMFGSYENSTLYACLVSILQPKSRGTVRLNSKDPYDPPLIDPNYYENPEDVQDVVQGLKTCMKIATSGPMQKLGSKPLTTMLPGCEQYVTDEDNLLECLTRSVVMSLSHQVGTAKMGDPTDPTTVVDSQLRVKNIQGLRVVDASVMPIVPSGNTNIPTIVVAEKAADLIKATLNCNTQLAPPISPSP
ncbi:hypothetical protein JTE90_020794 [Oedothorax gibbosus]|uniref:Glucose-methanol-choline oxidoreductase N-terminal domain-containing protein n=1 Tax=Oedothorax gibbosus TaxID=931172 RepID=A0AAV6TUX5_9ARAC|nr:hypothetical protein JTE90_020794 [Oedothorax gibbosus]